VADLTVFLLIVWAVFGVLAVTLWLATRRW
jgi:hypothetical protein